MFSESKETYDLNLIQELETELKTVLEELAPLLAENNHKNTNKIIEKDKINEIFEKLEPMLINKDTECLNLLEEIHSIQGANELAAQIEEYNFRKALEILLKLKKNVTNN